MVTVELGAIHDRRCSERMSGVEELAVALDLLALLQQQLLQLHTFVEGVPSPMYHSSCTARLLVVGENTLAGPSQAGMQVVVAVEANVLVVEQRQLPGLRSVEPFSLSQTGLDAANQS